MNFFVTINMRHIKNGLLIILISFFTALFLFSQQSAQIPVISTESGPKAIYKGEKGIALTFNIGWGDMQAGPILDVLEKEEVRSATFFLSGAWAEKHPEVVQRIKEMGFEIGSLGYAYEDYTEIEDAKIRRDITKSIDALRKLDIKEIKYIRSPTGHFDKKMLTIADQLGLTVVHWSLNTHDWKNPGVDIILEQIHKAKDGEIILMHASDSALQTAEALPAIISELKKKGELMTISHLISNGKVKTTFIP